MKLQTLTVIFIIIILPITMVVSQFIKTEISTINTQTQYDTILNNATYDAIKAFQLNESNSSTANVTSEKMRDVEASVQSFYNSLSSNMGVSGYNEEDLKGYIPCLVYTLYDGYYIYTSYPDSQNNNEKTYGLKPYVYYTEKIKEGQVNVTVSYTLDSYITVCGTVDNGNTYINKSGYLCSANTSNINEFENLNENIEFNGQILNDVPYKYMQFDTSKKQSIKYYYINDKWYSYGTAGKLIKETNETRLAELGNDQNDKSAENYINKSNEFTGWVSDKLGAVKEYLRITSDNNPDNYSSKFNEHRREIIKKSIKSNLEATIFNYKGIENFDYDMPELDETMWDKIINNVNMISIMQGLPLKNKYYRGYSVVTNTQSREFVNPDELYLIDNYNVYHKITCLSLNEKNIVGVYRNVDFRRKSFDVSDATHYYYPHGSYGNEGIITGNTITACYECLVTSSNTFENTNQALNGSITVNRK